MSTWRDRVELHRCLDSSMFEARRRALADAPEGTTVVALEQTHGRGRRARVWFSKAHTGVFLTTVLRPMGVREPQVLGTLALAAAVGVLQAARSLGVQNAWLKWPNDVMVGDRKLAGILMEADGVGEPSPMVLLGVGLNITARTELDLPDDLVGRYIGIQDMAPHASYDTVLQTLLRELEACYHTWRQDGPAPLLAQWGAADGLKHHRVRAEAGGSAIVGLAEGIDAHGHLRVRTGQGMVIVGAGEVERIRDDEGRIG